MKLFGSMLLASLALFAPLASAEDLSITQLCIICDACDAANDISDGLCDPGAILDFSCAVCEALTGGDEEEEEEDDEEGGLGGLACFSGVATVDVLGKGPVSMKNLNTGDFVLTSGQEYQPVYAFAHKNAEKEAAFLKIYSEGRKTPLEMTAEHLLFVEGSSSPVRADAVKVGDVLQGEQPAVVKKIAKVARKGIYAPLTLGGTVVVDGVVASSYVALNDKSEASFMSHHNMAHIGLSPYRLVCSGISAKLCSESFSNADGMPYFVQFGLDLLSWALGLNAVVKAFALTIILGVTGAFFAAETLFGASTAPLAIFTLAGMYALVKKNNAAVGANKVKSV